MVTLVWRLAALGSGSREPSRRGSSKISRTVVSPPTPERHQETVVVAEGLPFYTKPTRKSFKMPATAWASSWASSAGASSAGVH